MIRVSLEKTQSERAEFFSWRAPSLLRVFAKYGIIQPIACKGENYARLRH